MDGLLVRVAQGDEKAFVGVYDALVVPVMGLAYRILRDEAQAEEVTQERDDRSMAEGRPVPS